MIHNKIQLKAVEKEITDLQMLLEKLDKPIEEQVSPDSVKDILKYYAWENRLKQLELDVEQYHMLSRKTVLSFSEKELQYLIVSMRIASGMTYKQLAEAIDIQEQQIQRYEQTNYLNASFERIIQIIRVLSKKINLEVEIQKDKSKEKVENKRFEHIVHLYPHVEKAKKTVKERKQLMAS